MSQSRAVYQPTTVTYESNNWQNRPINYLTNSVSIATRNSCLPTKNLYTLFLILSSITSFSLGLIMLIQGAIGYSEQTEDKKDAYLVITIFGAIFFSLSILLFVFFMRFTRKICWKTGKNHINTNDGQNLTVNPSTDMLVTAQYAPISEVNYQPTSDDTEEQSKLMPEKREIINEDTDRMIENDPRIVLRPLNPSLNEDT